jgi:hypothetical protein
MKLVSLSLTAIGWFRDIVESRELVLILVVPVAVEL